ncbi:hypothetical protein D3C87_1838600 [compost metagenome]
MVSASITKALLDRGHGEVVVPALKAGTYGILLTAYDGGGELLVQSFQTIQIADGQTAQLNSSLALDGANGLVELSLGANTANQVSIPPPSEGSL